LCLSLQYLRKLCSHPLLVAGDAPERVTAALAELPSMNGRGGLHSLEHSPKLVALKEILDECGVGGEGGEAGVQHRVLIFAQLKVREGSVEVPGGGLCLGQFSRRKWLGIFISDAFEREAFSL
jgi:SNF2 family DNA or RNA helicase